MAIDKLDVNDGKYTVEFDDSTGQLRALRYGEPWRDLAGDNLVYYLFVELRQAKEALAQLRAPQGPQGPQDEPVAPVKPRTP